KEHFCTLFDSNFLPAGLALHASLQEHCRSFHLWIICMDEALEQKLGMLCLQHVSLIPVRDLETPELLSVKKKRKKNEYCWTVTPFSFSAVFDRAHDISQVTYLDADLFFFKGPEILLEELSKSGKDVFITRHAYAPEYVWAEKYGIYCVQFLTCTNTEGGKKVIKWWQEQCLRWCYSHLEDGKFGDQKYLDNWTEQFSQEVCVSQNEREMLAPWNVRYNYGKEGFYFPVFYHFHNFRIISPGRIVWYTGYRIGKQGERLYNHYQGALLKSISLLRNMGLPLPCLPYRGLRDVLKRLKNTCLRKFKSVPLALPDGPNE
ncbi:hypothetical protein ACFL5V_05210, partial [Fibrobacterota bacterium]